MNQAKKIVELAEKRIRAVCRGDILFPQDSEYIDWGGMSLVCSRKPNDASGEARDSSEESAATTGDS